MGTGPSPSPGRAHLKVSIGARRGARVAATVRLKYSALLAPNDGVGKVVAYPMEASESWVKGEKDNHLLIANAALKPDAYGLLQLDVKGQVPKGPIEQVALEIWVVHDGKSMWKDELADKRQYGWNLNTMREKQVPETAALPTFPDRLVGYYTGSIERDPKQKSGFVYRVANDGLTTVHQVKTASGEAMLRWSPDGERYYLVAIPETLQARRLEARIAIKLTVGGKGGQVFPFQQTYLPVEIKSPRWWFVDMRKFVGKGFDPDDRGVSDHPLWMPDPRPDNQVKFQLDGIETYNAMAKAMKTATRPGHHFIYLAGWDTFHDFNLERDNPEDRRGKPDSTLGELLRKASDERGVMIRALFWFGRFIERQGLNNNPENTSARDVINHLKNGRAILDGRTNDLGSHHQKLVLVYGSEGLIAFAGGRDFHPNRVLALGEQSSESTPEKKVTDRFAPLLDVHVQIRGRAAYDLLELFLRRYVDHPTAQSEGHEIIALRPSSAPPSDAGGDHHPVHVRVCATFGDAPNSDSDGLPLTPSGDVQKKLVPQTLESDLVQIAGGPRLDGSAPYSFAPRGRQSGRAQLLYAISSARKYIYFEDQYMVGKEIAEAIREAVHRHHVKVLGVIPHQSISDDFDVVKNLPALRIVGSTATLFHEPVKGPDIEIADVLASTRRSRVIDVIHGRDADPRNLTFLFSPLRTPGLSARSGQPNSQASIYQYVHSKVFIFDDAFCTIGSMNFNQRSTTHDSELLLGFCEPYSSKDGFAKRLRKQLWAGHLGLAESDLHLLEDPLEAIDKFWSKVGFHASEVKFDGRPVRTNVVRYDWTDDDRLLARHEKFVDLMPDPVVSPTDETGHLPKNE